MPATMSLLGLYNWDSSILDGLIVPDGVDRKRLMYAYALLVEKKEEKADKLLKEFQKVQNTYPLKGEIESEIELVKELARAKKVLLEAADEFEPSVITRYTLSLAGAFSKFYNDCQVMVEDEKLKNARLALVYATSIVIKETLGLLGIDCPEKMQEEL